MNKKKKKFSFSKLLYNNKFVFIFSVLAAFAIWTMVVINLSPADVRVIENVKVTVQNNTSEEMGLQLFGYEDVYVDVTVKGKRYVISPSALSANDISVVAKGSYIDAPGKYTLDVSASPVNSGAAFDIVGVTQNSETLSSISVYYDTLKTEEFDVAVELTAENGIVPDGYISDKPISSLSTVSISGPATEINKIDKVVAYAKLDSAVTQTTIMNADVVALTKNDAKLENNHITYDDDITTCTVTLPVYMKKVVDIGVRYLNLPSDFPGNPPSVTISPSTLTVAAAKSTVDKLSVLYIGSINFNKLTNTNNVFKFKTADVEEVKVVDEIEEVTVSIDFSGYSTATFEIPAANITCLNVPDGFKATASSGIQSVTVVGPYDVIDTLTVVDVLAKVDFASEDVTEGDVTRKADVYLNNKGNCWVYGSYSTTVTITK